MIRRLLYTLSPASVPFMTRQSYRFELTNAFTFPVAMALTEGGVVSVVASKAFDAGPLVVAILSAAPMFGNLTSFIWARLARGRRKIRTIVTIQAISLLLTASVALLPMTHTGGWMLAGIAVGCRCLLAGIITLRSMVWRMNYPRNQRGKITSRLAIIVSVMLIFSSSLIAMLMDRNEQWFRILYPAGALLATVGITALWQVRLRGERGLLRQERQPVTIPASDGLPDGSNPYVPPASTHGFWHILRSDPLFRQYMLWQFILGGANHMTLPAMAYMVSNATQLNQSYLVSMLITTVIPSALAAISLPIWGRMLDSLHISRFRIRQSRLWISGQFLSWVGAVVALNAGHITAGLSILIASMIVLGVDRGGGMLAWNLGHNDFASRKNVAAYMGVHVTLTGVRGAFAPFLGMVLYVGWDGGIPLLDLQLPLHIPALGVHVFGLAACLGVIALLGFHHLARSVKSGTPTEVN